MGHYYEDGMEKDPLHVAKTATYSFVEPRTSSKPPPKLGLDIETIITSLIEKDVTAWMKLPVQI